MTTYPQSKSDAGDQVIWWLRERCGKSEQVHAELKTDLAGGQLPSGVIGANAAWWALAILAHNLNAAMKRLVLGRGLSEPADEDAALPSVRADRPRDQPRPSLIIRLGVGAEALGAIITARETIRALVCGTCRISPGRTLPPSALVSASAAQAAIGPACPVVSGETRDGCTASGHDSRGVPPSRSNCYFASAGHEKSQQSRIEHSSCQLARAASLPKRGRGE